MVILHGRTSEIIFHYFGEGKRSLLSPVLRQIPLRRRNPRCASKVTPSTIPAPILLPHLRPTRAGVHGSYQGELGWEGEGTLGPADGDHLVLHGLSHHLQHASAELRDLVQEKHSVVGQADLDTIKYVRPGDES